MRGIIWGADRNACGRRLERLIKDYELYWDAKPLEIKETKDKIWVKFEYGDVWEAYVAHESNSCGKRCNVSLIDSDIDADLIYKIEACTTCSPYGAIGYF